MSRAQNKAIADMLRSKLSVRPAGVPQELRALRQWVCWKYETRNSDKPTKIPYQPNGQHAKSTDPATWSDFGTVVETLGFDGIGFVFSPDDPYVGIDLDDAIGDDGLLKPWAQKLVDRMATYTEISPSGGGVKLWCKGVYPGDETGKKKPYKDGAIEMYHRGRYFCVTGHVYDGTPATITEQQSGIDGIYTHILNPKKPQPQPVPQPATDATERCMKYIAKCDDAISGNGGHDRTFHAACICFKFGLCDSEAWRVMHWYNGAKCSPQWTQKELEHKIEDAKKQVTASGEFGEWSDPIRPPRVPIAAPPKESSGLLRQIQDTIDGKRENISWPWPILTRMARCLMPGTITVLCGMGGSTKSLLIADASLHWMAKRIPFAVFHLEEDREFHQLRALAQLSGNSNVTRDEWGREHQHDLLEAYYQHEAQLNELGESIWDAPASDVSLVDVEAWVKDRAEEGRRVIVVDPVTAADSGREPWIADRRFVLNCKRIMRDTGASLIVVTHPRNADAKGNRLDNHAGGQAYNRFTQTVLNLSACSDEGVDIIDKTDMGTSYRVETVNRRLSIHKARNGAGTGWDIGYWFDGRTLRFTEHGLISKG